MKQPYQLIISLFLLSVFALTAAQSLTIIKNSAGILGINTGIGLPTGYPNTGDPIIATPTPKPIPVYNGTIPCSVVDSTTKLFCPLIATSTTSNLCSSLKDIVKKYCPTITPQPSTYCKTGVNSFAVGTPCTLPTPASWAIGVSSADQLTYRTARYSCYDGFSGIVGNEASCYPTSQLISLANQACYGRSSCTKPTSTPISCYTEGVVPSCSVSFCCPGSTLIYGDGMTGENVCRCVRTSYPTTNISPRPTNIYYPTNIPTPKISPYPTTMSLNCGWCGSVCMNLRPGIACADIAPPANQTCRAYNGYCRAFPTTPLN